MNIAILGAGAIGSFIGARLSVGLNNVTLINRWAEHIDNINNYGLKIDQGNNTTFVKIKGVTSSETLGIQDLVIVMVKSYQTEEAVANIKNLLGPDTRILTLQNGLGNAEQIIKTLGNVKLLAGTTAHGSAIIGPGHIKYGGSGETVIGPFSGPWFAEDIATVLSSCGLITRVTNDVTGLLWGKVLINAGINALTAICGVNNGWLIEREETLSLMKSLVNEGVAVAKRLKITLPYDNPLEKVISVARATGENRSSMLQDLDHRKKTEIDYINGAIINAGIKTGIPTPCNNTITLLVKALESKYCLIS
ncbi:MAG: 2-dehydropantoate 2-reductase [Peptococcaceae bacterium]|nr:2-dehydropantoate 2-reductase [Peptococcaceae bacterium]